ncbi:NAD(P)-binding protein [Ramaria rubella]|nr:NAD(P)-binding protein [Ramaria rubella]
MSPRVAVITGSARGIGKAIALRLAKDGLNVVVSDISSALPQLEEVVQEIKKLGVESMAVVCDVTAEADVQKLVDTTVDKLGSLDVMVANAGIIRIGSLIDTKVEEWDLVQTVNARGIFLCYRAAARQMIKQGKGGRIIGASSVAGKRAQGLGCNYSASKFAVRALTQSASAELYPHNITVNAYAPGNIQTAMLDDLSKSAQDLGLGEVIKQYANQPTGTPEDIAGLVSYIASEESRFITGQALNINGGIYVE